MLHKTHIRNPGGAPPCPANEDNPEFIQDCAECADHIKNSDTNGTIKENSINVRDGRLLNLLQASVQNNMGRPGRLGKGMYDVRHALDGDLQHRPARRPRPW